MADEKVEQERILRTEPLYPSDTLKLPVGIVKPGDPTRYRTITIDELCGVDEELIATTKVRRNASLATTKILSRCIQTIPGLVQDKTNPHSQFPDQLVSKCMTQIDRDFVLLAILVLSGRDETVVSGHCENCDIRIEENLKFQDLEVYDWPEDAPLSISGTLPKGYVDKDGNTHRDFTMRFVTGDIQELVLKNSGGNSGKASSLLIGATMEKLGDLEAVDSDVAVRRRTSDRQYIGALQQSKLPGVMLTKKIECEDCGRSQDGVVDLSGFFAEAWRL